MKTKGHKLARRATGAANGTVALASGLAGVILSVGLLGSGVAWAQDGEDKPLTFGVQEVTTYDSNPARGAFVDASQRGLTGSDVIVSPAGTVAYSRNTGLNGLTLRGNFGYDYHPEHTTLNGERIDFSASESRTLGAACSLRGSVDFNRGQSGLQYLTIATTKNILQDYGVTGSETCGTASGLTESLSLSRTGLQNSASTLVNSDVNGASGLLGYSNHIIGTVGITFSYNQTTYGHQIQALTTQDKSMDSNSIGVQLNRPIGARLSGSINVSYTHSNRGFTSTTGAAAAAGSGVTSGLTAAVQLAYIASPRLQLSVEVSRQIPPTSIAGVGFQTTTGASVNANYTISSRISTNLGASRTSNSYIDRDPLILSTTPSSRDISAVFANVSVKVGRRVSVSANFRHEIGVANLALYNYTADIESLTLATSF